MMRLRPYLFLLMAVIVGGCAHARDCGLVGSYHAASAPLLECAAASGDKFAQLELGIRYETGAGVPRDIDRAESFYERAARTDRRSRYVYSAPMAGERYGRVIPVSSKTISPGLAEARERLRRLREAIRQREE